MASSLSPFRTLITDLRQKGAEPRRHRFEGKVDWGIELSKVAEDVPVVADLDLIPGGAGIMVRGPVTFTAVHTCHRCLEEWREETEITVTQLFTDRPLDEDDYEFVGDVLDIEPMLRDEVLLAMPLVPDCGPDCVGLVAAVETDLNTEPDEDGPRSPFEVLRELFPSGD